MDIFLKLEIEYENVKKSFGLGTFMENGQFTIVHG